MNIVWTAGDIFGFACLAVALAFGLTWLAVGAVARWFRRPPRNNP